MGSAHARPSGANVRIRGGTLLLAALLSACDGGGGGGGGGPTGPGPVRGPAALERVSPAQHQGVPGYLLDDSLAVRVLDATGTPLAGQTITFAVTGGGGSVSPASAVSGPDGVARAAWTLGAAEGAHAASATVAGVAPVTFSAEGRFGPEAALSLLEGGGQTMPTTCALPTPLRVRVVDAAGAPVQGAAVFFRVASGGGTVPVRVASGADGIAQAPWTLGAAAGEQRVEVSIRSRAPASLSAAATAVARAPGGYAVIGNRIVGGSGCREHRFTGIARSSLESWHRGDDRIFTPALAEEDFRNMRSWGANVVRIPLNQAYWLTGTRVHDPDYRALVVATVGRARAAGLDVILDLHYSDRGDPNAESFTIQRMADRNHSLRFWREVAETFRDDGRVMFELYNEPHDISWEVWLNGGDTGAGFAAAGMQELHDAVRSVGAHNLVLVNGLNWGFDLSGVRTHPVRGYNIVYSTHPYDWPEKQPAFWDEAFGYLADDHPVIVTEFGAMDCGTRYYREVLDYADQRGLHWVAWAWYAPPADRPDLLCTFASLISDWNGTPTPMGEVVRDRLRSYPR